MLATCLTLCAVALGPGTVVSIPAHTPLLEADAFNWVLQERSRVVPAVTRAIVLRMAPAELIGVVEVKVFDKTNRLYWVEAEVLNAFLPTSVNRTTGSSTISGPTAVAGNDGRESEPRNLPRRRIQPNFAQVDAAIASMMQSALRDHAESLARNGGLPTPAMTVHTMPVCQMEVFSMPVFQMEVFTMPVFHMPVFQMAVF